MLIMLRQTDCTERAGDQSSVRIDRQMWPLLYTWGWTGIFSPVNITCKRDTKKDPLVVIENNCWARKSYSLRTYFRNRFWPGQVLSKVEKLWRVLVRNMRFLWQEIMIAAVLAQAWLPVMTWGTESRTQGPEWGRGDVFYEKRCHSLYKVTGILSSKREQESRRTWRVW